MSWNTAYCLFKNIQQIYSTRYCSFVVKLLIDTLHSLVLIPLQLEANVTFGPAAPLLSQEVILVSNLMTRPFFCMEMVSEAWAVGLALLF